APGRLPLRVAQVIEEQAEHDNIPARRAGQPCTPRRSTLHAAQVNPARSAEHRNVQAQQHKAGATRTIKLRGAQRPAELVQNAISH
ncbi:hypothetical protein A2U01_0085502, partial [Trifolium medium]|nr:hypothetical protein [Trifolium medium]